MEELETNRGDDGFEVLIEVALNEDLYLVGYDGV
jgi:hypothetical protein